MFYVFKHGRAALQRIDWRLLGRGSRDWGVQISHGEAPLNRLNSRTGASSRGGAGRGARNQEWPGRPGAGGWGHLCSQLGRNKVGSSR